MIPKMFIAASFVILAGTKDSHAAGTEPPPAPAAKPLVSTIPDWKPVEDDPLPPGALVRIGSCRARHGIGSSLVSTADGKYLVAGFFDRSVRIWEAETGKLVRQFKPVAQSVRIVAVSRDGKTIAGASAGSIHLWDVAAASDTPRTLQGHQSEVMALAFSADGKTLLSGGYDYKARLWNVAEGKPIREIAADDSDGIMNVAFTRDEKSVATCSYNGRVKIWKAENGEFIRSLEGMKGLASLHSLPGGKTLAGISLYEGTFFWNLETGKLQKRLNEHTGYGTISADGTTLVSCPLSFPADSPIRFYDLAADKELRTIAGNRSGTYLFVISPDRKTLTTYGNDRTLRRWDLKSGREIGSVAGHQDRVMGVTFTADGKQIISCGQDGTVRFSDASTGKELRRLTAESEHFESLALSADGKLLALGSRTLPHPWRLSRQAVKEVGSLHFWDVANAKEKQRFNLPSQAVRELHFMPDAREVMAVSWDRVSFIDVNSGKQRRPIPINDRFMRTAAVSPDGKYVTTSTGKSPYQIFKIAYWEADKGRKVFSQTISTSQFNPIAYSPDGKWLAVAAIRGFSLDRRLVLWTAPTDTIVREFATTTHDIIKIAYSPDGRLLAAADSEGISIFETSTGQQRWRFAGGHAEAIGTMAFAPDSRKFVTGGDDTLVVVWDLTGNQHREKGSMLDRRDLDAAWSALADLDGEKAGHAIMRLSAYAKESVPYLRQRLGVLSEEDQKRIDALVAKLDDDSFRIRDRAAKELTKLGEAAVSALERAAKEPKSQEVRTQAERLLRAIGPGDDPAAAALPRRAVRAIEVLEHAGTPESVELLKELSLRATGRLQHAEAKESLNRIEKRRGK